MIKNLFSLILLSSSFSVVFGQVGINTETPHTTLDVVRSADKTKPDGIQAPRVTFSELEDKNEVYGTNQTGAVVYVTVAPASTVTPVGKVVNVKTVGYYYFDGAVWQSIIKEPWHVDGTTNQATSNTQDIYQMGKVGVRVNSPTAILDVEGEITTGQTPTHTAPLRLRNIEASKSEMLSTTKKNTLRPVYIDDDGVLVKLNNPVNVSSSGQNQSWYFDHDSLNLMNGGSDIIAPGMAKQPTNIGDGTIVKFSFMSNFTFGVSGDGLMYGTILFTRRKGFTVSEWELSGSGTTFLLPELTSDGNNWTLKLYSSASNVLQFDYESATNKIKVKKANGTGGDITTGVGNIHIFNGMKMR